MLTQIHGTVSEDWGPTIMKAVKVMTNEKEGAVTSLAPAAKLNLTLSGTEETDSWRKQTPDTAVSYADLHLSAL